MPEDIEKKVKSIVCDDLGIDADKVKSESTLTHDLGADSIDVVELVMAIEDHFDIEIPDSEADKIKTVGHLVDFVMAKKGGKDNAAQKG